MINEVKIPKGNIYLYDDKSNKYPKPNTVARTVKVLGETNEWFKITYPQLVGVKYVWVKKSDIGYVNPVVKPSPVKPSTNALLNTGDTMVLSDVNGKRIGVWTFKKE